MYGPPNHEIAEALRRIADLLEAQDGNRYRISAYRRAARVVALLDKSAAAMAMADSGEDLEDLPDIGRSIGGAIREYVHSSRIRLLDRLEGQVSPEDLFSTVATIGETLAHRIHDQLGIDTLEELELAAHSGRLKEVPGIGRHRSKAIRDSVEATLNRSGRRRARRMRQIEKASNDFEGTLLPNRPSVEDILKVDAEYRRRAAEGKLKTIRPRRFNPEGIAWLPVLHMEKGGWNFTALFSNTARAHDLGKTRDWVVIYFEREGYENQCTVVTEHRGSLKGKRVIRGLEKQCRDHYFTAACIP